MEKASLAQSNQEELRRMSFAYSILMDSKEKREIEITSHHSCRNGRYTGKLNINEFSYEDAKKVFDHLFKDKKIESHFDFYDFKIRTL